MQESETSTLSVLRPEGSGSRNDPTPPRRSLPVRTYQKSHRTPAEVEPRFIPMGYTLMVNVAGPVIESPSPTFSALRSRYRHHRGGGKSLSFERTVFSHNYNIGAITSFPS